MGNPRRNPCIITDVQSHHIHEVNIQQRKPNATNAAKKTLQQYMQIQGQGCKRQLGTNTASISTVPELHSKDYTAVYFIADVHTSRLQLSRAWTTQDLSQNQTIMAEHRTFITDVPHRLWSQHWSNLQHPTTQQVKTLFWEKNIQLGPPTVKQIGYTDSSIKNFHSITVFLYHGNEKYKVLYEVEDSSGHAILGRDQVLRKINMLTFLRSKSLQSIQFL